MILEALVGQLLQRFQHEKRAQVCLWFDERQEFQRLMPALREHLAALSSEPFRLLEYDRSRRHGQVWLRHQIYRARNEAGPHERRALRFVLYLPVPEERLERAGPDREPALELLTAYRWAGTLWRIGGKKPTLFSFLRQAGVALPEEPAEQRRLWDGGPDSLLAKYVAKFADRPTDFSSAAVTAELVQTRLLGDVDRAFFDLAADPEGEWRRLAEHGLDRELTALLRERYGIAAEGREPADWLPELVEVLALHEAFAGYGEPADFPFTERLPPVALRQDCARLLKGWLRDSEGRPAWDRLVREVEARVDLTHWAKGREGLAFGFPHLVELRWQEVARAFDAAAARASSTRDFFARYGDLLAREAEYARASRRPAGAWDLLVDLQALLRACDDATTRVEKAGTTADLAGIYTSCALEVEARHLRIRLGAEEHGLPAAAKVADRVYASYANPLNARFFELLGRGGTAEVPGVPPVAAHAEETVWRVKGRRAVVIVDALRYDCALALRELLGDHEVRVEPLVAPLPTVTPVGMTALLPLGARQVTVEIKDRGVHPMVAGKDMAVRSNRVAFLRSFGADCREIQEVEAASEAPREPGELLVVVGLDEVDDLGHDDARTLVRHAQAELARLARLVRKLHRWGYPEVHVLTDHGFVLMNEEYLPEPVPCERDWCLLRKERFALVRAGADVPLVSFEFGWNPDLRVAVPPGLAFFKGEKAYSHGGASLQELVVPHLVSVSRARERRPIEVEVVLRTYELDRAAVRVLLRPRSPSVAAGQMTLFAEAAGRDLALDVVRPGAVGERASVLAGGKRNVRLEPRQGELAVTLFFDSGLSFTAGELLDLDIRDAVTSEQFPPGGIKLTVGRDL